MENCRYEFRSAEHQNMASLQQLRLSGQQIGQLRDLLTQAFLPPMLIDLMLTRLDKPYFNYAGMGDEYPTIVAKIIAAANAQLWWRDLLREARNAHPTDPGLLAFAEAVGQAPVAVAADGAGLRLLKQRELELKIRAAQSTFDVLTWRKRLGDIESRVCRIELPTGQARGTGFLVAPDLVMTNYHVVERLTRPGATDLPKVVLRFDYKVLEDGVSVGAGKTYGLAINDWLADHSPYSARDFEVTPTAEPSSDELDYALLRVNGRPGDDPVGGDTQSQYPVRRGWLTLPSESHVFLAQPALYIVQHPDGKPMQIAIDSDAVIAVNANKTRVRYTTTTEPGSSGAPCFSADWEWIALHHSGDPKYWKEGKKPDYNQGIPVSAIVGLLAQRGKAALLGSPN
jgi:V8-like Glu-specific endopeptidase